jgi:ubiquinol-cytochrome c reductase cytochrome c1 subunit
MRELSMPRLIVACVAAFALGLGAARAADEAPKVPQQKWSFDGPFGTFDRAALQRGLQVYKEVCSVCHAVEHLAFRHLGGGPPLDQGGTGTIGIGWDEEQVKAFAESYKVPDINDDGQPTERPARPADKIPAPFPNEKAARASNNGALPPDLSLIAKAREDGPNYVFALLNGYDNPPGDFKLQPGMNYNKFFPGHQIAMPKPLNDEAVSFADGTKATVPQMAHDVVAFLEWAAEPDLEDRHQTGLKVIVFLVVMTVLFYATKRKIWSDLH